MSVASEATLGQAAASEGRAAHSLAPFCQGSEQLNFPLSPGSPTLTPTSAQEQFSFPWSQFFPSVTTLLCDLGKVAFPL